MYSTEENREVYKARFFTKEIELFKKRYNNGYDLSIDSRYIMWLDSTHPEEAERLRSKDQPAASKDGSVSTAQKSDEFSVISMKTKPPASVCDAEEGTSIARRTRTRIQMPTKQCTVQQNCKRRVRTNVSTVKEGGETKVKETVGGKPNTEARQRITRSQTKKDKASSKSLYQVIAASKPTRGISSISDREQEDLVLSDFEDGKLL